MAKTEWDYCLELKGITPARLPMARLAQYLAQFAALLGDESRPVFAGVVKGSALLRARDQSGIPKLARARMRHAATDETADGRPAYERITNLCQADRVQGRIIDREKAQVIAFPTSVAHPRAGAEIIVNDTAEVDGVVVGVEGVDDTAHIRLADQATGRVVHLQVRDMALARSAAKHFRSSVIRIRARGTWRRDSDGSWHPHSLHAESIEELDQSDARAVFNELRTVPGVAWADMSVAEADALLTDMRGDD